MNRIFLAIALLAAFTGSGSCGDRETGKSNACNIVSFTVNGEKWDVGDKTVTKMYPKGTVVNNLSPVINVSPGASVTPASGAPQDFSDGKTVTYTVTAEDGSTKKSYTVTVTVTI